MTMSDAQFYLAVATLLRVLAEQEPGRRVVHLAEEAERRAMEARQGAVIAAPEGRERC